MIPRADEEHARASFDRYLRHEVGLAPLSWEAFPNGNNKPPDFNLCLGADTFAVEVTSLFTQYAQDDGSSVPEESIWKATERLTDEVELEAAQAGTLRGGYVLTLDGPYDSFFQSKRQIRKHLLAFIADTQEISHTAETLDFVLMPAGQRCAVNKYESSSDWVAAAMHSDGGGWGWEVVTELRMLVEVAVATKAQKLRDVPPPRILRLLDRHHIARTEDYARVRHALEPVWAADAAASAFHSIYIIQAAGGVFPLRTG